MLYCPKNFEKFFLKIVNCYKFLILILLSFIITLCNAYAAKQIQEVNYFSSFRASETNVRSGPGQNYPIKYTYKVKGIPVRVISEYDNWNEVEDYEGQTGWVMQSLITKKRMLMVYSKKPTVEMRIKNNLESHLIFRLENFVIGEYLKCDERWCAIKINGKKGWVERSDVFGADNTRINNELIQEKNLIKNEDISDQSISKQSTNLPEKSSSAVNNLENKREQNLEKNIINKKSIIGKNDLNKLSTSVDLPNKNNHKN
jgi:SH3-like domain-containing protein